MYYTEPTLGTPLLASTHEAPRRSVQQWVQVAAAYVAVGCLLQVSYNMFSPTTSLWSVSASTATKPQTIAQMAGKAPVTEPNFVAKAGIATATAGAAFGAMVPAALAENIMTPPPGVDRVFVPGSMQDRIGGGLPFWVVIGSVFFVKEIFWPNTMKLMRTIEEKKEASAASANSDAAAAATSSPKDEDSV